MPKSHPLGHDPGNRMKNSFNLFSIFYFWEYTHKVWYKNLKLNGIWLLTSPWGHQFDPSVKFYLYSVVLIIPVNLICHMTMLEKKEKLWPNGHPQRPKVPPLGHDQGDRMKFLFDMFYIFYLWEHTQSLVYKIFEIDFVIERTSDRFLFNLPKFWQPVVRIMHNWQLNLCA